MNWLISYNHSGNSWVRYCIEYLTQLPTHGHRAFSISERKDNFLGVDIKADPIVVKRHEVELEELDNDDRVILLIRNPKDAIKESMDATKEFEKHYKLLLCYVDFRGKNKRMVKFNDLFSVETIISIVNFYNLDIDKDRLKHLKENFKYHQEQSKSVYQNRTNEEGSNLSGIRKELLDTVQKYL